LGAGGCDGGSGGDLPCGEVKLPDAAGGRSDGAEQGFALTGRGGAAGDAVGKNLDDAPDGGGAAYALGVGRGDDGGCGAAGADDAASEVAIDGVVGNEYRAARDVDACASAVGDGVAEHDSGGGHTGDVHALSGVARCTACGGEAEDVFSDGERGDGRGCADAYAVVGQAVFA